MARFVDLNGASDQFSHSLSIKPQAETWHNLAVVYRRLGQTEKADAADQEREKLLAVPRGEGGTAKDSTDLAARPTMRFVDNETFAATATPYGLDGPPANSNKAASVAEKESFAKRWIAKLNPWPNADKSPRNTNNPQNSEADHSRSAEAAGRSLYK